MLTFEEFLKNEELWFSNGNGPPDVPGTKRLNAKPFYNSPKPAGNNMGGGAAPSTQVPVQPKKMKKN